MNIRICKGEPALRIKIWKKGHEVQIKWRKSPNGYPPVSFVQPNLSFAHSLVGACKPEKKAHTKNTETAAAFIEARPENHIRNINFRWSESIKGPTGDKMSSGKFGQQIFFSPSFFCLQFYLCYRRKKNHNIGSLAGWFRFYSRRFHTSLPIYVSRHSFLSIYVIFLCVLYRRAF